MDNKVLRSYDIKGRTFFLTLSLCQDEILAPVVLKMYQELPGIFSRSSKNLVRLAESNQGDEGGVNKALDTAIDIAIDLQSIKAWILSKRYGRKLLAVLLVESGREFSEADIAEKEIFFAQNAPALVTDEVITFFLSSSILFGKNIPTSSPETERDSIPTTR